MQPGRLSHSFNELANTASRCAGRAITFALAAAVVVIWAITGPLFGFSDTWQLVINTATTIVTFLMVFLIQNSQNRDSSAIQVKLDEIIRHSHVRNSFIGIEHLTDDEIEELRARCERRAKDAREAEEAGTRPRSRHGSGKGRSRHFKKKAHRAADKISA